jgi:hypothetical protein
MLRVLQIIVEKITGRTCDKCKHCISGVFCNNMTSYEKCVKGIFPKGFEKRDK